MLLVNYAIFDNMSQYAMFKNPSSGYESFVEGYCLRRKNSDISEKQELLKKAQNILANEYKDDKKPFVRYLFYVKYYFNNNARYFDQT